MVAAGPPTGLPADEMKRRIDAPGGPAGEGRRTVVEGHASRLAFCKGVATWPGLQACKQGVKPGLRLRIGPRCTGAVMRGPLETDHLMMGPGVAGMAFTDALLSPSDATVTLVDRRHAPGGHRIDAPVRRAGMPSLLEWTPVDMPAMPRRNGQAVGRQWVGSVSRRT